MISAALRQSMKKKKCSLKAAEQTGNISENKFRNIACLHEKSRYDYEISIIVDVKMLHRAQLKDRACFPVKLETPGARTATGSMR